MTLFAADAAQMRDRFPDRPFKTSHGLAGHPLLSLDALANLAGTLDRDRVEFCGNDVKPNQDPVAVTAIDLAPAEIVRQIETCGAWMVLKQVQTDPRYRALLNAYLLDVAKCAGKTSLKEAGFEDIQGFIFVASAQSVTPFHVDHEENMFAHLAGDKTMHIFDNGDHRFVDEADLEPHPGKHRNLRFQERFQGEAQSFRFKPGEGVFVPYLWPHWVETGSQPTISMQISWKSPAVQRLNNLRFVNGMLRRMGWPQRPPGTNPHLDGLKAAAYKTARAAIDPLRKSEWSRRLLRGLLFGKSANYYYEDAETR